MWLLPVLSGLAGAATRVFYRFQVTGPRPPRRGAVLLLANHPNSLFDPALVAAAARRSVRFLAKSTLFTDPRVGWLVRAAGAIPVYRRSDEAQAADRNVEMFTAVFEELTRGAAVGIFPEGISHSEPSLAKLKTGSARIALGTYARHREVFPLIPIGLVLRNKGVFRSEAMAVRGEAVPWGDLAERGEENRAAVRELTRRIDAGLREVTVNLERWEDRPLIECAQAVWAAEMGDQDGEVEQVERARIAARVLADLRRRGGEDWVGLARELMVHRRRLRFLALEPADLDARLDFATGAVWAVRRLHLLAPPAVLLAVAGAILFWPPYQITDRIVAAAQPTSDQQSTYKALVGTGVYLLWILLLGAAAWRLWGRLAGLLVLVTLPAVGVAGQWIRERWRGAWSDVRRFFLLRSRRELGRRLQAEQKRLAKRLAAVYEAWRTGGARESPRQGIEIDVAAGQNDADPLSGHVEPSGE